MGIKHKAIPGEAPLAAREYPKLRVGKSNLGDRHDIVLFTSPTTGMVIGTVHPDGRPGNRYGFYSETWSPDRFEDYYGSLILSSPNLDIKE